MYVEDLVKVFESTVKENNAEFVNSEFISNLSVAITNKKYDIQDQALIEIILKEDKEKLAESFSETLKLKLEQKESASNFINSEKGQKEIINLFLKSIENMIDFYYNSIISKQFSST